MSRKISTAGLAVSAAAVLVLSAGGGIAHAQEQACAPPGVLTRVSGSFTNNAISPGETLGSGSVVLADYQTMTCGLKGTAFLSPDGALGGFVHTIVCDDEAPSESGETVHSQVVSVSRLDGAPDFQSCGIPGVDATFGSFREISEPQSGRGIFSPTGGGRTSVRGTINCAGSVELTFRGDVCVIPKKAASKPR
jgi:hypothetical protein